MKCLGLFCGVWHVIQLGGYLPLPEGISVKVANFGGADNRRLTWGITNYSALSVFRKKMEASFSCFQENLVDQH